MSNNYRGPRTMDIPLQFQASTSPTFENARELLSNMIPHLETAVRTSTMGGGHPWMAIYTEAALGNIVSAKFGAEIFVANLRALLDGLAEKDRKDAPNIILTGE